jgi:methyl-accepting chemotaxis protein WspA
MASTTSTRKGLSIEWQLFLAFAFIGILVSALSLVGYWVSQRLANRLQATEALWKINEGQTQVQVAERSMLNFGWSKERRDREQERIKGAWVQINEGFAIYQKISGTDNNRELGLSDEEKKLYSVFIKDWDAWEATHKEFMGLEAKYEALGIDLAKNSFLQLAQEVTQTTPATLPRRTQIQEGFAELAGMAAQTRDRKAPAFQKATESLSAILAENQKRANGLLGVTNLLIVAVIIGPLLCVAVAWYFVQTVARPLSQLVQGVQSSGIKADGSASQIAISGRELEATVTEQAASTREVLATAQMISNTSRDLAKTMEHVTRLAEETANSAQTSQSGLSSMEATMLQLTRATETIAAKLGTISDKADRINTIITTITKVADQTNLLSLNASIEAEKAGEYGRGFAVVAREIRRLADQTAVATLDIESMVREMQSSVATGVMEVDKFSAEVGHSAQAIHVMGRQLATMIDSVTSLTPQFATVDRGMSDQAEAALQISEAMMQISDTTSLNADALKEVNSSIADLETVIRELREDATQIAV